MIANGILGGLACLSLLLLLWQWLAGRRFALHQRAPSSSFAPGVSLLKPLKGCEAATEECLRSWLVQEYGGPVQLLFAVASADDPVCRLVQKLLKEFPGKDARLVICGPLQGANLKISKLMQIEGLSQHELLVVSDADVMVSPDFLKNAVLPLQSPDVGLVNCFYRLANPATVAMQWEAVAINADFWSQVLQSRALKRLDFALGAVMIIRRRQLAETGGFAALADCLADDYQLGNRLARRGLIIALSPLVVECWSDAMGWPEVWKHQLRWARTIRVCQPAPYFLSILSNSTLWPLLWLVIEPGQGVLAFALLCWIVRLTTALNLQKRLTRHRAPWCWLWLVALKDLLQAALWGLAFMGNRVEWRGEKMRLRRDGTLKPL